MQGTVHARWCDRFHLQTGTPECSRLIREVEGLGLMIFANGARVELAVVGAEGRTLAAWPPAIYARVAAAIDEAVEAHAQAIASWYRA